MLQRSLAVFLSIVLIASPIVAQQAPEPVPGVIRINVNLVQVDAVVTDSKGRPVTNLKAEDFEVLQDGKPQKIRNFEFVRVNDPLKSIALPVRPASASVKVGAPPPSSAPTAEKVRRTVALVVDDLAMSFDGIVRTRDAIRKWVDVEMQPTDLVSIVRTQSAIGALQQFTNDKRLLYSAIDRLKYQPGRVSVGGFKPFDSGLNGLSNPATGEPVDASGPDTANFDMELESAYILGSFNAIRFVIKGLRDLPGRKSMVLFSEDLSIPSLDSTGQQRIAIEDRLRLLADDANRSSVVMHAIDARGSVYTGLTSEDAVGRLDDGQIRDKINARMDKFTTSQDGMVMLTQRTGGLFISGDNDFSKALRKVVDDGDGYYLMGYQPDDSTFDLKMDTLKFHSIKVRVKRSGLSVRSRTGFFGLPDARPLSREQETPQTQLARAIVSPFTTGDIRVRLTGLLGYSDTEGTYVSTMLHLDANDLAFKEEADGARSATVDIAVITFDGEGVASQTEAKTWTVRFTKDGFDEALKSGLLYSVLVPVKKAGPYQLRLAVRDTTTRKLGSAMQFIEVPNVKGGQLALSGIVVGADARPLGERGGTPVIRAFKTGDSISYAYEVFNPRVDSAKKAQLETRTRFYLDGEVVYESAPTELSVPSEKNRLTVVGHMALKTIPAGEYVMQVIVSDKLRKDKSAIVAQTIDFEVR